MANVSTLVCASCHHVFSDPSVFVPRKTSLKAIASLVFGVLASVLTMLAGVPAIVLGILALREIRRSDQRLEGQPLAMAGIACGTLFGVLCVPLQVMIGIPFVEGVRRSIARRTPIVRADVPAITMDAPLTATAPVADGVITPNEYVSELSFQFDTPENPGRLYDRSSDSTKIADDLSLVMLAAHTPHALYLAFRVTDQFIENETARPAWQNDSIEVFLDGDGVVNDFTPENRNGNREGFQLIVDSAGKQGANCSQFKNGDWRAAAQSDSLGYIVEFEIPLALIDTADGSERSAAQTGSRLWFNVAINDEDGAADSSDAVLWAPNAIRSRPYHEGEAIWSGNIILVEATNPANESPPQFGSPKPDR